MLPVFRPARVGAQLRINSFSSIGVLTPGCITDSLLKPENTDLDHDDGGNGTGGLDELGDGHIGSSFYYVVSIC